MFAREHLVDTALFLKQKTFSQIFRPENSGVGKEFVFQWAVSWRKGTKDNLKIAVTLLTVFMWWLISLDSKRLLFQSSFACYSVSMIYSFQLHTNPNSETDTRRVQIFMPPWSSTWMLTGWIFSVLSHCSSSVPTKEARRCAKLCSQLLLMPGKQRSSKEEQGRKSSCRQGNQSLFASIALYGGWDAYSPHLISSSGS